MSATAYQLWADIVRQLGGAVTTMPKDSRPAARYPAEVYVPRVNKRTWPIPDAFVNARPGQTIEYANGKRTASLGYYLAPTDATQAARRLTELTTAENIKYTALDAAQALKDTAVDVLAIPRQAVGAIVGVPPWVVPAAIVVGGVVLVRALLPVLQGALSARLGAR